jgi:hypothetical protein
MVIHPGVIRDSLMGTVPALYLQLWTRVIQPCADLCIKAWLFPQPQGRRLHNS